MIGASLGLLAAVLIGIADLYGRRITPVSSSLTTALSLQMFAALFVAASLLLWPGQIELAAILWGACSGVGFTIGLACYYKGLSTASSAIIAPLSAVLSVFIPFLWGVFRRLDMTPLSVGGVGVAFCGLILVTRGVFSRERPRGVLRWGLCSGVGYGIGQAVLLEVSLEAGPLAVSTQRFMAFMVLLPVVLGRRNQPFPPRGTRLAAALAGLCAGGASAALFQGLRFDPLSTITTVAVFPVFTVAVGRYFYADSITKRQGIGVLCALVGTIGVVIG